MHIHHNRMTHGDYDVKAVNYSGREQDNASTQPKRTQGLLDVLLAVRIIQYAIAKNKKKEKGELGQKPPKCRMPSRTEDAGNMKYGQLNMLVTDTHTYTYGYGLDGEEPCAVAETL